MRGIVCLVSSYECGTICDCLFVCLFACSLMSMLGVVRHSPPQSRSVELCTNTVHNIHKKHIHVYAHTHTHTHL